MLKFSQMSNVLYVFLFTSKCVRFFKLTLVCDSFKTDETDETNETDETDGECDNI